MKQIAYLLMGLLLVGCGGEVQEEEPVAAVPAEPEPPPMPLPGEMVLIPAGEFLMGSDQKPPSGPAFAAPQHKKELPAYYIDAFEVTNAEFIKFTIDSGYESQGNWRNYYTTGKEDFPVANITWNDAVEYCKWAGKRLPTEAEWEKAARGTEGFAYPWGNDYSSGKANFNETGRGNTVDVRSFPEDKSAFGVYGMGGNVQEWTADSLKPYPNSPARGADAFQRGWIAVRGGSYALKGNSAPLWTRSAFDKRMLSGIGCRCAKDAEAPPAQASGQ